MAKKVVLMCDGIEIMSIFAVHFDNGIRVINSL